MACQAQFCFVCLSILVSLSCIFVTTVLIQWAVWSHLCKRCTAFFLARKLLVIVCAFHGSLGRCLAYNQCCCIVYPSLPCFCSSCFGSLAAMLIVPGGSASSCHCKSASKGLVSLSLLLSALSRAVACADCPSRPGR